MSISMLLAAGAATLAAQAPAVSKAQAAPAHSNTNICAPVTVEAVNAQFARFNDAWQTRNPDTVTALFSQNASLLPTVSGRFRTDAAGIRDYFVTFLQGTPVGTVTDSETTLGCNIATRVGNWTVNMANAQGQRSDVSARFSFIYVYENGDWRIHHLHSSLRPAS